MVEMAIFDTSCQVRETLLVEHFQTMLLAFTARKLVGSFTAPILCHLARGPLSFLKVGELGSHNSDSVKHLGYDWKVVNLGTNFK